MIKHLLPQIDSAHSASQLCQQINVLKAVHWIAKSWLETKSSTIESCFRDAGFPSVTSQSDDE